MAIRQQCSISRRQWDSQLECGTLMRGNASTMREQLQFGSITQSARGHNQTLNGPMALERVLRHHNAQYPQYVSHIYGVVRTEHSDANFEQIPRG
eukprot:1199130-Amphidinium_carterae.1